MDTEGRDHQQEASREVARELQRLIEEHGLETDESAEPLKARLRNARLGSPSPSP